MELSNSLKQLLGCSEFIKLQQGVKRLNFFEALGVKWREVSHSRLLAYLLNPSKPHGLEGQFLRSFLLTIFDADPITEGRSDVVDGATLARFSTDGARIYTEYKHIDVVIDLPKMGLVVGIENKLSAGEQEQQVERYQNILGKRSRSAAMMVFLTPGGRPPRTGAARHDVPCVQLCWSEVGALLENLKDSAQSDQERFFMDQNIDHIRKDIMGDADDKKLVQKILANPELARVIQKIRKHTPNLGNIRKEVEKTAEEVFGAEGYELWFYPEKRGAPYEIKIGPKTPGTIYEEYRPVFMLYYYPEWSYQPFPGLLVCKSYKQIEGIRGIHARLAEHEPGLSPDPEAVHDWGHWYNLMSDEQDGMTEFGIVLEDMSLGPNFLKNLKRQIQMLDSMIKGAAEKAGVGPVGSDTN